MPHPDTGAPGRPEEGRTLEGTGVEPGSDVDCGRSLGFNGSGGLAEADAVEQGRVYSFRAVEDGQDGCRANGGRRG